jgi:hypothetical protein
MKHFKILLETGKKLSTSRAIYVKANDAGAALNISNKIRYSKLTYLREIDTEEYMKGVSGKYSHN